MRIIDSMPTPGSTLYNIICPNGHPFNSAGDSRGRVKCPKCKREGNLREMVKAWKATPAEQLQRLQEISVEARALFARYEAIPELKRADKEGREIEARMNEYYEEAKRIMSAVKAVKSGE